MKNYARIKSQIRNVYLLRGMLAGVIVAVLLSAIMLYAGMFIYNTVEVIFVDLVLIVFFTLLFFLFSFWKSNKVLRNIRSQDREFHTVPFDAECFAEAGESRVFFLGSDWLLWHRDLNTKAWHRDSLVKAERVGAKDPENRVGMLAVTGRDGKEEKFPYRIGETDAAVLISSWLVPVLPEDEEEGLICPQCGAAVQPGEQFCGNCGARLTGG